MSQVRVLISMSLTAVASAATVNALSVDITDAAGNNQHHNMAASEFPSPDSGGNFTVEVDFSGIGSGAFAGVVVAVDEHGSPVGDPVLFNGTASNLQPIPVSVTVAFA